MIYIIYVYLFHPRYLHTDIFRSMTSEITHDISFMVVISHVLRKLITLVFIATRSSSTLPPTPLPPPGTGQLYTAGVKVTGELGNWPTLYYCIAVLV